MSAYEDARELVIDGLDNILADSTSEYREGGSEEPVRSIHVQSIVYRLMDQV